MIQIGEKCYRMLVKAVLARIKRIMRGRRKVRYPPTSIGVPGKTRDGVKKIRRRRWLTTSPLPNHFNRDAVEEIEPEVPKRIPLKLTRFLPLRLAIRPRTGIVDCMRRHRTIKRASNCIVSCETIRQKRLVDDLKRVVAHIEEEALLQMAQTKVGRKGRNRKQVDYSLTREELDLYLQFPQQTAEITVREFLGMDWLQSSLTVDSAIQPYNISKHRSLDVVAADRYRYVLKPLKRRVRVREPYNPEQDMKEDYINATVVNNGFLEFIQTPHPMTNTVGAFWRMVKDSGSSTIVMIMPTKADQREFPRYWPLTGETHLYDANTSSPIWVGNSLEGKFQDYLHEQQQMEEEMERRRRLKEEQDEIQRQRDEECERIKQRQQEAIRKEYQEAMKRWEEIKRRDQQEMEQKQQMQHKEQMQHQEQQELEQEQQMQHQGQQMQHQEQQELEQEQQMQHQGQQMQHQEQRELEQEQQMQHQEQQELEQEQRELEEEQHMQHQEQQELEQEQQIQHQEQQGLKQWQLMQHQEQRELEQWQQMQHQEQQMQHQGQQMQHQEQQGLEQWQQMQHQEQRELEQWQHMQHQEQQMQHQGQQMQHQEQQMQHQEQQMQHQGQQVHHQEQQMQHHEQQELEQEQQMHQEQQELEQEQQMQHQGQQVHHQEQQELEQEQMQHQEKQDLEQEQQMQHQEQQMHYQEQQELEQKQRKQYDQQKEKEQHPEQRNREAQQKHHEWWRRRLLQRKREQQQQQEQEQRDYRWEDRDQRKFWKQQKQLHEDFYVTDLDFEVCGCRRWIRHYHFHEFHNKAKMYSGMILLIHSVLVHQYIVKGLIIIHCADGADASGVFIALSRLIQLHQNRPQDSFNVENAVKHIKRYKPQAVRHIATYRSIYTFLQVYLNWHHMWKGIPRRAVLTDLRMRYSRRYNLNKLIRRIDKLFPMEYDRMEKNLWDPKDKKKKNFYLLFREVISTFKESKPKAKKALLPNVNKAVGNG